MKLQSAALFAAVLLSAVSARAKVNFTGYGDLRYDAGATFSLDGPPATLSKLGTSGGTLNDRGFSADAVGLFATTELQENLQFLMDVTFRSVGNTVGQLEVQYAYLDWTPLPDVVAKGGRITLPFGYYNENRFYAFDRYELSPPIFQSAILGLPIADWGAMGQDHFHFSPFTVELTGYLVNGYGNVQGEPTELRTPAVPGALSLASNLHAADNNDKPAGGGRVALQDIGGQKIETGLSYYGGDWDQSGLEPMYMIDYDLHADYKNFDLLFEALHLGVRGDAGFAQSIGAPNWTTDGGFVDLSYDGFKVKDKPLAPYVQFENYRTHPDDGGTPRETLRSIAGGAAYKVLPQLTFKAEYLWLSYLLPDVSTGGWATLRGYETQLAAVVTF